jgi:hypothetical protein
MTDSEVLDRLKAIAPLFDGQPRVYAWPGGRNANNGNEYLQDQWARITRSTPLSLAGTTQDVERAVERCRLIWTNHHVNVSLCIHVSPPVPTDQGAMDRAIIQLGRAWHSVYDQIASRARIRVVYIDFEGLEYVDTWPQTDKSREHNHFVREYNQRLYNVCRTATHGLAEIRRHMHMGVLRRWRPKTKRYTTELDPVDGGWGITLYRPHDRYNCATRLQDTIDHARKHNIRGGTIWLPLGCTEVDWDGPGGQVYPKVAGRMKVVPYDPARSYLLGAYLGNPKYRNDPRHPEWDEVHSVVIWPNPFHPALTPNMAHVCAFLEGLSGKGFDPRLREMQKEAWGAR